MPINHFPDSLESQVADLLRRVQALEGAPLLQNSNITEPGGLTVRTADGVIVGYIGRIPDADGTQMGTALVRDDGTLAFEVARGAGSDPATPQTVSLFDHAGNRIVADDVVSGEGLAVPWLPYTAASATNPADSTTSTSWSSLVTVAGPHHNPRLYVRALVMADAGTTAEFRIYDQYGAAALTAPVTVTGTGSFAYQQWTVAAPGDFLDDVQVALQARVTAGSGKASARVVAAYGMQS